MSLSYIGDQLDIYGGFFFFITGLFGNGMNIFIFSSVRTYRTNPSTFYFLIGSIINVIYIIVNLTVRIVSACFGINLVSTSLIWCQMRAFIIGSLSPISFTCSCLATIDQFLATSQNGNLRHRSNIKSARVIVIIVIIIWCLHGIPVFLYYNIPPITYGCASTNPGYGAYVAVFVSVIICAIPVFVIIIFGYLGYRNIRLTRRLVEQHPDRQMTKMTLIQAILVVISISPSGIFGIYLYITTGVAKDADRIVIENFANIVLVLVSYFFYIVCLSYIMLIKMYFSELILGKFLYVFHFIKSFSSNSKRSNIVSAETKSSYSILYSMMRRFISKRKL